MLPALSLFECARGRGAALLMRAQELQLLHPASVAVAKAAPPSSIEGRWLQLKGQIPQEVALLGGRQLPGRDLFVVSLAAVDSRVAAEALVGAELLVRSDDRPKLAQGEFHLLDLVGTEVRLLEGQRPIGRVCNLIHAGNDLLEVEQDTPTGSRRLLIPFVTAIVPEVHLAEGWIGITPPPGLLDL